MQRKVGGGAFYLSSNYWEWLQAWKPPEGKENSRSQGSFLQRQLSQDFQTEGTSWGMSAPPHCHPTNRLFGLPYRLFSADHTCGHCGDLLTGGPLTPLSSRRSGAEMDHPSRFRQQQAVMYFWWLWCASPFSPACLGTWLFLQSCYAIPLQLNPGNLF